MDTVLPLLLQAQSQLRGFASENAAGHRLVFGHDHTTISQSVTANAWGLSR